ncbi:hypothetical protein AgCh_034568 [Apium graveolens]
MINKATRRMINKAARRMTNMYPTDDQIQISVDSDNTVTCVECLQKKCGSLLSRNLRTKKHYHFHAIVKIFKDADATAAELATEKKENQKQKEIQLASKGSILASKKQMSNVLTIWKQRSHEGQAPGPVVMDVLGYSAKGFKRKLAAQALFGNIYYLFEVMTKNLLKSKSITPTRILSRKSFSPKTSMKKSPNMSPRRSMTPNRSMSRSRSVNGGPPHFTLRNSSSSRSPIRSKSSCDMCQGVSS